MSKYRSTIFFKDSVMSFLLIYLFYALANLFFIPNYSAIHSNASFPSHVGTRRQTVNTNHDTIDYVLLAEKSIVDEDQLSNIKSFPGFFLLSFNRLNVFRIKKLSHFAPKAILHNFRHSYLSFCILRI